MNVFVVGANGQIGRHLVRLLAESDQHTPIAMVRQQDQASAWKESGVESRVVDLHDPVNVIADAANGCDAIVFTAGSGGHTGAEQTLLIDLDGAVKTMEAAQSSGIDRFLLVSAIQAHVRDNWHEAIRPYFAAKHYADKMLEHTNLTYTILRPGGLTNDPGTGTIQVADNLPRATIPREDVALTLFAALTEERTYRRAFDLVSGDVPVADALRSL